MIVYFSTKNGNTHRLVTSLYTSVPVIRIPIDKSLPMPLVESKFILIVPTYADNDGVGAVPSQVKKFLNIKLNRDNLAGVIGTGHRNFGKFFGIAADEISKKCEVPILYKAELSGSIQERIEISEGINTQWKHLII